MKYDYSVVIGRFQPLHLAHQKLIEYATSIAPTTIIVLGSHRSSPDTRNPFSSETRESLVRKAFPRKDFIFKPVRDYYYNEHTWITEVQNAVNEEADGKRVAIVGFFKDGSSYYLNSFPQWSFEEFYLSDPKLKSLGSTEIRELFFGVKHATKPEYNWTHKVPAETVPILREFEGTKAYYELKAEYEYIVKYKQDTEFKGVSYKPVFITTDAVVVQSGHLLVVRRGDRLGKGKLALPGGFLQPDLTLEDNMLKELKEETQIKVSKQVLRGNITESHVFDYPARSQRGRTVTHAFLIELQDNLKEGLPRVKGGDDAAHAQWIPLSSIGEREDEFFEDHYAIINFLLRRG